MTWNVLPHEPIQKLGSHLWIVRGNLPSGPLKRVMSIAKRASGALVIHNGICLEEERMSEIEALGKPEVLVVPNGYHRLDAGAFKSRYSSIQVVCPKGARARVEEVVKVDATYDELADDDRIRFEHVDGTREAEGALFVKSDDGTSVILNDVLFNMKHGSGVSGFVLRHITASSGGPTVSRIAKWFLVKDKAALRGYFEKIASTRDLVRLVVSHDEVIDRDPAGVLREVAAKL